jgi:hypothetical protein
MEGKSIESVDIHGLFVQETLERNDGNSERRNQQNLVVKETQGRSLNKSTEEIDELHDSNSDLSQSPLDNIMTPKIKSCMKQQTSKKQREKKVRMVSPKIFESKKLKVYMAKSLPLTYEQDDVVSYP